MPLSLLMLALGAFAIGTSEFVIVGLLQVIAEDLHVTVPSAGMLVSYYAVGVVIGAPLFTIFTSRVRRDRLLFGLLVLFAAGNLICALAPDYRVLMLGRVIAAMSHGSFFGVGAVVAASLVPAERSGSAIATMFFGLTLANIVGVPLGTEIGQHYGWRATFWIVTAFSTGVAAMLFICLPRIAGAAGSSFRREIRVLLDVKVGLALAITICTLASIFCVFTFVSELLVSTNHAEASTISLILLVFGLGMSIGVIGGGTVADRRPVASALVLSAILVVVLLSFIVTKENIYAMAGSFLLLGLSGAGLVPGLQARVLRKAVGAPNLASSFNIGAFNIGNALGAWIGSQVLTQNLGFDWLAVAGAICAVAGLAATGVSTILDYGASGPEQAGNLLTATSGGK